MSDLSYNSALWETIPADRRTGVVAQLCKPDQFSYAEPAARLIEQWFNAFGRGNRRLLSRLTSPDDDTFWSSWWELAAARFFAAGDFTVEMEPKVGGLTPDLSVDGSGVAAYCEVFVLNPAKADADEEAEIHRLSERLRDAVRFDDGLVAIMLLDPLRGAPSDADLLAASQAIQRWLDDGHVNALESYRGGIRFTASWMPHAGEPHLNLSPAGRAIGGTKRFQDRIGEKLGKYGDIGDNKSLLLFIASQHWTLSSHGVIEAMLGTEQITFDREGNASKPHFSGDGALVIGGPGGYDASRIVAGFFMSQLAGIDEDDPAWLVRVQFAHNPYADKRIADDTFSPLREYQVRDDVMAWNHDNEGSVVRLGPA